LPQAPLLRRHRPAWEREATVMPASPTLKRAKAAHGDILAQLADLGAMIARR